MNGPPFTIEEVHDLDAVWPELESLFVALVEYHRPYKNRTLRSDWAPRWREYIALGPDRLILIVRKRGEAVGYLIAQIRNDYGLFEERYGFIDDLYVREEARSEGIGRGLVKKAEAWFRQNGIHEAQLSAVAANKRAVRFWTLSGYGLQSMRMSKSLKRDET